MSEGAQRTVSVYVRKGEHEGQRMLSVRLEDGIDPLELLDLGFAIDGNQAIIGVESTEEEGWADRLNAIQRLIVAYLATVGYVPQFA